MRLIMTMTLLLLAGCASAEPDYYTLSPIPGHTRACPAMTVEVRTPSLADYLDRQEMSGQSGYNVSRNDKEYWAEPLDKMVERTLAQDLGQRLPGSTAVTESSNLGVPADIKVNVDLQQFEPDRNGHSSLVAQVAILKGAEILVSSRPSLTLQSDRASTGVAMASAMSRLTAQLADHIADDLSNRH